MALPKNSKIIDVSYLEKIFYKMLEKYADYEPLKRYFKMYEELQRKIGKKPVLGHWSAMFPIMVERTKRKTGFDFFKDADKLTYRERSNQMGIKELEICAKYIKESTDKIVSAAAYREKYRKEMTELAKEKGVDFEENDSDYLINKVAYLKFNAGLLAKLMGFDVAYSYCPGVVAYKENSQIILDGGSNPEIDCFNVVDYSDLVVCSEPFEQVPIDWDATVVTL